MNANRRHFLVLTALAPLALLGSQGALAQEATCYAPDALSLSQKNRRRSLGFMDIAADPKRRCGGCAFFTATSGNCGTCQMLSGGPVSNTSSCGSFAPKGK